MKPKINSRDIDVNKVYKADYYDPLDTVFGLVCLGLVLLTFIWLAIIPQPIKDFVYGLF